MSIFEWRFWRDAIERAVRDAAGAAIGIGGTSGLGFATAGWTAVGAAAGIAALASLLLSLLGSRVGESGSASLLRRVGGRHELRAA